MQVDPWVVTVAAISVPALTCWVFWRWTHRRMLQLAELIPGPPALPIIGNALLFLSRPSEQLDNILAVFTKYGEYVRLWLGPDLNVCVKNPDDIRLLLTCGKINEKGPLYQCLITFLGPGLLTGGPTWRRNRKVVLPYFSKKAIQHYSTVFNQEADNLAQVLEGNGPGKVDIYLDVLRSTNQCVWQTLMGLSKDEAKSVPHMEEFVTNAHSMYIFVFTNMTHWWFQIPVVYWLCRKAKERYYLTLIDEVMSDVIQKRRRALEQSTIDEESTCIVDSLINSELTEREVKWEILTTMLAGQDASAKILSSVLVFLAHLPVWQEKVYNEIVEVLDPHNDFVTEDELKKLHNLDLVFKEAIRYKSVGAFIQRTVEEEVTIKNGTITLPVGASVIIPIHSLHRDPKYWDEPDKVKPERFLPENSKDRNPNAFVPFSLGAMDCLGRVFAINLIKTYVVRVLRQLELQADGALEDLDLQVAISVSFDKGYNLRARPRQQPRVAHA